MLAIVSSPRAYRRDRFTTRFPLISDFEILRYLPLESLERGEK